MLFDAGIPRCVSRRLCVVMVLDTALMVLMMTDSPAAQQQVSGSKSLGDVTKLPVTVGVAFSLAFWFLPALIATVWQKK